MKIKRRNVIRTNADVDGETYTKSSGVNVSGKIAKRRTKGKMKNKGQRTWPEAAF